MFRDLQHPAELAGGDLREPGRERAHEPARHRGDLPFEMARTGRTLLQSIVGAGDLHVAVFRGVRLGHRLAHHQVDGVSYGAFIVPGLIMLILLTQSVSNASFGIYFPKFTGTIYEMPVGAGVVPGDRHQLRRRGGHQVDHAGPDHPGHRRPVRAAARSSIRCGCWLFLLLTAVTFSLLGFIIGIWADNFEKLQLVPLLIVTPLTFLGGSFYSIHMLPPFWQKVTLFNPVVYLISGFRWSFYGKADVSVGLSLGMTRFSGDLPGGDGWIFRTGWRLKA